jgi:hypothetical protein
VSELRRGCIGAMVVLGIFESIGGMGEQPANYTLRCLQGIIMMMIGFAVAVSLFGRPKA